MSNLNENSVIFVESLTDGTVVLNVPGMRKIEMRRKGAKQRVKFGDLEQMMYEQGVEFMFKNGMVDVAEDQPQAKVSRDEIREALYLEPMPILKDQELKRLMTTAKMSDLDKFLAESPREYIYKLVDFAIANELSSIDRCDKIRDAIGIDIISAIRLNKQDKEA